MCGIFAYLDSSNNIMNLDHIDVMFNASQKRGPESSVLKHLSPNVIFGFHRLAINGLTDESNQPMIHNQYTLICNGEIFNYKELANIYNYNLKTKSDCEIILHLYESFGVDSFKLLDGEFAFLLYDKNKKEVIAVRDTFGIRPLYINDTTNGTYFSSTLSGVLNKNLKTNNISQVIPGSYTIYNNLNHNESHLYKSFHNISMTSHTSFTEDIYMNNLYTLLETSIIKRITTSEREVCCLLSGGLDSSLVSAICSNYYKDNGKVLETFSIGLKGSLDLYYAKKVSQHIGSIHHEIICTEEDFIKAIPNVIKDIESYDITTVRASVGNWLIGKYIKKNTNFKVVLNGDGADELMGGYLYFNACKTQYEFHNECIRLLENIHYFDVLRSDRSISSHGLEARTPFLDNDFAMYFLSIPIKYRKSNICEKHLIRKMVQTYNPTLLPQDILWRKKEAFSDGVSSLKRSWYHIIQESVVNYVPVCANNLLTNEELYYRDIFSSNYPNCEHLIPYKWMPRFITSTDPSARTLGLYRGKYEYFYIIKEFFTGILMNMYRKFSF